MQDYELLLITDTTLYILFFADDQDQDYEDLLYDTKAHRKVEEVLNEG